MFWGATVAATALAIAGCGGQKSDGAATDETADATTTMPSDSGMVPPTGTETTGATASAPVDVPTYVQTAASGDMFEIRSSQLALKQSQDRQVRDFAQRMITDHQASTAALKKAVSAGAQGTTIPTEIMPRHAEMVRALEQAAQGNDRAAFDRLYMDQQRTAHAQALDLHRSMAARGDVPGELKAFAQQTTQTVEGHHQSLMQMPSTGASGAMGGVGTSSGPAGKMGTPTGAEGAGAAIGSGRVTGAEDRAANARPS
jgi:putative membrane protein